MNDLEWRMKKHQTIYTFCGEPALFCYLLALLYFFSYRAKARVALFTIILRLKEVSFRGEYDH